MYSHRLHMHVLTAEIKKQMDYALGVSMGLGGVKEIAMSCTTMVKIWYYPDNLSIFKGHETIYQLTETNIHIIKIKLDDGHRWHLYYQISGS